MFVRYENSFTTYYTIEMIVFRILPVLFIGALNTAIICRVMQLRRKRNQRRNFSMSMTTSGATALTHADRSTAGQWVGQQAGGVVDGWGSRRVGQQECGVEMSGVVGGIQACVVVVGWGSRRVVGVWCSKIVGGWVVYGWVSMRVGQQADMGIPISILYYSIRLYVINIFYCDKNVL